MITILYQRCHCRREETKVSLATWVLGYSRFWRGRGAATHDTSLESGEAAHLLCGFLLPCSSPPLGLWDLVGLWVWAGAARTARDSRVVTSLGLATAPRPAGVSLAPRIRRSSGRHRLRLIHVAWCLMLSVTCSRWKLPAARRCASLSQKRICCSLHFNIHYCILEDEFLNIHSIGALRS